MASQTASERYNEENVTCVASKSEKYCIVADGSKISSCRCKFARALSPNNPLKIRTGDMPWHQLEGKR